MLTEIKVHNFAIIDQVTISFHKGLNVLSGETGSGKSILLKALGLLMGEKSDSDTIKSGESQATVEGAFDLAKRADTKRKLIDCGISEFSTVSDVDDLMIVKRILSTDGKNRVYINGSLSTLQQLREIVAPMLEISVDSAPLIELTGQHENRQLQHRSYHLDLLDQYTGGTKLRVEIDQAFSNISALAEKIVELQNKNQHREQRLEFLRFQLQELDRLNLAPGEEIILEEKVRFQKELSKVLDTTDALEQILFSDDDSALSRLGRALQKTIELQKLVPEVSAQTQLLTEAKSNIENALYEIGRTIKTKIPEADQVENLEDQLSLLRKLQKKYGPTVSDILNFAQNMRDEMTDLESFDDRLQELKDEHNKSKTAYEELAVALHQKRSKGSSLLAKSVNAELSDLNMKGVLFGVAVDKGSELTSTGFSIVEFQIQSSQKDSARSLNKTASGGELSRILLALKRVVGASEHPRTYLFDEVDTGVSGVTAEKLGRKLKSIAKGQQVICVTHLPQVAAQADSHFTIAKRSGAKGVQISVKELSQADQVQEIARMLSGEKISKTSIEHAKDLLGL
jgi:DNA repair protein RecN (Recombination protein N)